MQEKKKRLPTKFVDLVGPAKQGLKTVSEAEAPFWQAQGWATLEEHRAGKSVCAQAAMAEEKAAKKRAADGPDQPEAAGDRPISPKRSGA